MVCAVTPSLTRAGVSACFIQRPAKSGLNSVSMTATSSSYTARVWRRMTWASSRMCEVTSARGHPDASVS